MIREAKLSDAESIAEIYNYYIDNSIATFEEDAITSDEMRSRISDIYSSDLPWLVLEEDNVVLGYAYASKWSGRCAYRFSAEVTVYLSPHYTSKGMGTKLYAELFSCLRKQSVHIVMEVSLCQTQRA